MKDYATGVTYVRKVARDVGLIADSDNDDTLIQRVGQALKALEPDAVKKIARSTTGDNSQVEGKGEPDPAKTGPNPTASGQGQTTPQGPQQGQGQHPGDGQVFGK